MMDKRSQPRALIVEHLKHTQNHLETYQPAFTCSKSTMETPEQCVKSVQS